MIYVSRVTSLTYAKLGGGGGWKFFGVSRAAYTICRFMQLSFGGRVFTFLRGFARRLNYLTSLNLRFMHLLKLSNPEY